MTISEIAKMAGVSNAAVSRYLNKGSLSEEKKARIAEVIEKTGYVPSAFARTLRTRKSNQIGVIVPKIDSESVPRIVSGISGVLSEKGYQVYLADTNEDCNKELEYLEAFQNSDMDGVILLATVITRQHRILLERIKVPVVIIGQCVPGYACVYHDDENAARAMTEALIGSGCKRLGYIQVTQMDRAAGVLRTKGYEGALKAHHISLKECPRAEADFSMESGKVAVEELLKMDPTIDGIFCATDNIAIGAMVQLRKMGISVPEQMKVGAIGYSAMAEIISPTLSSVKYYYKTSGETGAKMLLDLMELNENKKEQILLGYEVMLQESTK